MDNNLNRIWNEAKESPQSGVNLSREEIGRFRLKRSKQIFTEVQKGILIAIVLKSVILIGDLVFIALFQSRGSLLRSLIMMVIVLAGLLVFEILLGIKVKRIEDFSDSISGRLNHLKRFFKVAYPLFHLLSALSNPLIVATGIIYYMQNKYSEVKFSSSEDIIVVAITLVLSYLIALAAGWMGTVRIRREVDNLLNEEIIDEDHLSSIMAREKKLRLRRIFAFSMIALLGIVLLTLLIIFNY